MKNRILMTSLALLISLSAFAQTTRGNKQRPRTDDDLRRELNIMMRKASNDAKKGKIADESIEALQRFSEQIKAIANKGSAATEAELMWVLNPDYPNVRAAYFEDLKAEFKAGKITQSQVNQVYRKFYGVYRKTRSKAVKSMEGFRQTVEGMTGLRYEGRQKTPYFRQTFGSAVSSIEKDLDENGMAPMTDEQKQELYSEFSAVQKDVKEADAATEAIDVLNKQFADCPGCTTTKAQ